MLIPTPGKIGEQYRYQAPSYDPIAEANTSYASLLGMIRPPVIPKRREQVNVLGAQTQQPQPNQQQPKQPQRSSQNV